MRIDREIAVEAGQPFEVGRFQREDAVGIASLYYSIYGPNYPFETYYIPERIVEENEGGGIHSVVARTKRGDIVAHGALYRSSPSYENLYEIGQYAVLKSYRGTFAAFRINQYISETLVPCVRPDAIFGEAVCTHLATQKSSALIGMKAAALEVGLMPADVYGRERTEAGRVACLLQFRSFHDRPRVVFAPEPYREQIELILGNCGLSRDIRPAGGPLPAACESSVAVRHFAHAGVARANAARTGADFEPAVRRFEQEAQAQGMVVLQFFLNMDLPSMAHAVEMLRQRGYFFGGCVPRWFDSDGMLMQKLFAPPGFDDIALHSAEAKQLRQFVRADWERAQVTAVLL